MKGISKLFPILGSAESQPKADWIAWILQAFILGGIVAVIKWIFPHSIPYGFWDLWHTTGSISDWYIASWPVLAWAIGFTAFVSLTHHNSKWENNHAELYLERGLWLSLRAGVMEEICFRWLFFMLGIVTVKVTDWILGGEFFSHGLVWVINHYIMAPVANFTTLHLLNQQLNVMPWFIGAGLLAANAKFRDGHKYQGIFGLINAWFIGMFFFYLMFRFGLVAGIVVHFSYDALIYGVRYLDEVQERARGVSDPDKDKEPHDQE